MNILYGSVQVLAFLRVSFHAMLLNHFYTWLKFENGTDNILALKFIRPQKLNSVFSNFRSTLPTRTKDLVRYEHWT